MSTFLLSFLTVYLFLSVCPLCHTSLSISVCDYNVVLSLSVSLFLSLSLSLSIVCLSFSILQLLFLFPFWFFMSSIRPFILKVHLCEWNHFKNLFFTSTCCHAIVVSSFFYSSTVAVYRMLSSCFVLTLCTFAFLFRLHRYLCTFLFSNHYRIIGRVSNYRNSYFKTSHTLKCKWLRLEAVFVLLFIIVSFQTPFYSFPLQLAYLQSVEASFQTPTYLFLDICTTVAVTIYLFIIAAYMLLPT